MRRKAQTVQRSMHRRAAETGLLAIRGAWPERGDRTAFARNDELRIDSAVKGRRESLEMDHGPAESG